MNQYADQAAEPVFTFNGQTTAGIAAGATAAQVQTALNALTLYFEDRITIR